MKKLQKTIKFMIATFRPSNWLKVNEQKQLLQRLCQTQLHVVESESSYIESS